MNEKKAEIYSPVDLLKCVLRLKKISQAQLVKRTKIPQSNLSKILTHGSDITPRVALLLEDAVKGYSAEFWMYTQVDYWLYQSRRERELKKKEEDEC